jgi:hypothetical protein
MGMLETIALKVVLVMTHIDGGAGSDTAIFKDASSAFTLTTNDNGSISVIHSSPSDELIDEGTDTLTSIEKIQFSDKTISTISLKYSLSETIDTTKNILKSYSTETHYRELRIIILVIILLLPMAKLKLFEVLMEMIRTSSLIFYQKTAQSLSLIQVEQIPFKYLRIQK